MGQSEAPVEHPTASAHPPASTLEAINDLGNRVFRIRAAMDTINFEFLKIEQEVIRARREFRFLLTKFDPNFRPDPGFPPVPPHEDDGSTPE